MQNPSQGVHRDLLPHVHCMSTFRYPAKQQVHHQQIAQWLREASEIAQSKAPFFWTYLDRPNDGHIFLTWQPFDALGTAFASDGYVWPPHEQIFQTEVDGGYILEMYNHKSGFGPGEQFTAHARHRYRLLPPRIPNGGPQIDSNLWITHYCAAEPADRVPSNMIPMNDPRVQATLSTRNYLQQQGAILRKEFMLRDAAHWPQIQWPHSAPGPPRGQAYGGLARTPQTLAYPPQALGPPAKRARTNAAPGQPAHGAVAPIDMMDDEEETSRGDIFDHMTPREISLHRYKQNHIWFEEVVSSPYAINQITPVDLGLGLKGPLASLTEGIFYAPSSDPDSENHLYDYVGRLDAGKAAEFRERISKRIEADHAEMEKMKRKHAKRIAKMKKGEALVKAEWALRHAADDPTDVGQEYWRLEGKIDEDEDGEIRLPKTSGKVDDIVAKVEASLGRHAAAVQELRRIQDGGLEETVVQQPAPDLSPIELSRIGSDHSGVLVNNEDADMGESSAAGLLDQFHTGFSSTSTPAASFPTPGAMLQTNSSTGTPNVPSPAAVTQPSANVAPTSPPAGEAMEGMENSSGAAAETNKEVETTGDWVVVPEGGVSPPATGASAASVPPPVAPIAATAEPAAVSQPAEDTPAESLTEDFGLDVPDDFNDLGDLDTAGEALAGFGGNDNGTDLGGDDHGLGGDLDIGGDIDFGLGGDDDVEMGDHVAMDSFDDAFAGVEPRDDEAAHGEES